MYFNVDALNEDYVSIFHGIMNYLPRIGEEIVFEGRIYTVTNVRHIVCEGKNLTHDTQLYLK